MDTYYTVVTYLLTGIFGLCIGSFLNVVIYRVPNGMSVASPPSHCPNCNSPIKWYDNIPVLSYIILGAKCRNCKEPISPRYMLVEITNAVLWLVCVWRFWDRSIPFAVITAAACSVCLCIFFIDLENLIIPDRFQVMLAVLGIGAAVFDPDTKVLIHIIGAAAGGISFFAIGFIASRVLGREALGGGDIKFAFCAGLFLGVWKFLLAVLIASVSASILLVILNRIRGDEKSREYPFGPFLTVGFAISMIFGTSIIEWYISLLI